MRKTKKLIAVILSVVTLLSATSVYASSVGSIASDTTVGVDTVQDAQTTYADKGIGTSSTDVYLTVDNSNITVGVPTTVIVSGTPTSEGKYIGDFSVSVTGDMSGTNRLYVGSTRQTIPLYSEGKDYKRGVVSQEQVVFDSSDLARGTTTTGKVEATSLTAGSWHGEFNIDINIVDYSKEPIIPSPDKATYVYVAPNGSDTTGNGSISNPYASLWKANESITTASESNPYVIKLADGTYNDLETVFSDDSEYLSSRQYYGYVAKDNVYYLGNPEHPENVVIDWNFANGFADVSSITNDMVTKCEIFHIFAGVNTAVSGLTLNAKNTLRVMHVETASISAKECRYSVSNCVLNYLAPDIPAKSQFYGAVVGKGGNDGDFGVWRNCTFNNYSTYHCWGVHDNIANATNGDPATYIIENCTFNCPVAYNTQSSRIGTSSQNRTDKHGRVIIIGGHSYNADGEYPLLVDEGSDITISTYNIDITTATRLVYDDDINDLSFYINGKQAYSNKFYVLYDRNYKVCLVGENAKDYYVSGYSLYKEKTSTKLVRSSRSNLGSSFVLDTSPNQWNDYGTSAEFYVSRKDGSAITSADLNKIQIHIEKI